MVFYGLPENPLFYPEILNLLQGEDPSCVALFTKYDRFKLERIVGTERAARMLAAEKGTFMFV